MEGCHFAEAAHRGNPVAVTRAALDAFLRAYHRPAHARRTADRAAAFFLPHLRPGMALVDIGCGPGSITRGLLEVTGRGVGVDLDPGPAELPLVKADATRLPFPDASFDAIFLHAILQHVDDAAGVLREARRVARPGAVVGVADADWGGAIFEPPDPWVLRGQEVREQLRAEGDVHVGRRLRGLLNDAGFVRAEAACTAVGATTADAVRLAATAEVAFFEAEAVITHLIADGIAGRDECREIAAAWRHWGEEPGAVRTGFWFEALAWAPSDAD